MLDANWPFAVPVLPQVPTSLYAGPGGAASRAAGAPAAQIASITPRDAATAALRAGLLISGSPFVGLPVVDDFDDPVELKPGSASCLVERLVRGRVEEVEDGLVAGDERRVHVLDSGA